MGYIKWRHCWDKSWVHNKIKVVKGRSLSKVVQRGGLPPSSRDRVRVEQLLRGAVSSDTMLIQLRLREQKIQPSTFLQLLREIRAEEEI